MHVIMALKLCCKHLNVAPVGQCAGHDWSVDTVTPNKGLNTVMTHCIQFVNLTDADGTVYTLVLRCVFIDGQWTMSMVNIISNSGTEWMQQICTVSSRFFRNFIKNGGRFKFVLPRVAKQKKGWPPVKTTTLPKSCNLGQSSLVPQTRSIDFSVVSMTYIIP